MLNLGPSSKTVLGLFLFTLTLLACAAQFPNTDQLATSARIDPFSGNPNAGGSGSINDPVASNEPPFQNSSISSEEPLMHGYISLEDLTWISDQNNRENIKRTLDQVRSIAPARIPDCTYSSNLYDPITDACVPPCVRAQCGPDMLLVSSADRTYGACECRNSCPTPCWARPFVLVGNQCFRMATQGPCRPGQVLVPLDSGNAECGADVCIGRGPKNAINFSTWSSKGGDNLNDGPFLFVFKNECYMTETEAFCGAGKVVRFLVPYKSPYCVPRDHEACPVSPAAPTDSVKTPCKPGFVEDGVKNLCVKESLDFDGMIKE